MAPLDPPTIAPPLYGEWNHLEASIGLRGMGKSTHQCARALELSRAAGGAYVIGHSLGARLPPRLPPELGGITLPISYYDTIAKLEIGLRRHPARWHILAPTVGADASADTADDLLRFAIRLAEAMRKAAWGRAHPFGFYRGNRSNIEGVSGPPLIVIIDEGIAVEAGGASKKDANRWFLELLYSLRHMHTALLYAIQDASARSFRILEQASAIHVFRVHHAWALQSIQAAGASADEIEAIKRLPRFNHTTLAWSADDVPESDPEIDEERKEE